jgi:hypothetical protein
MRHIFLDEYGYVAFICHLEVFQSNQIQEDGEQRFHPLNSHLSGGLEGGKKNGTNPTWQRKSSPNGLASRVVKGSECKRCAVKCSAPHHNVFVVEVHDPYIGVYAESQ